MSLRRVECVKKLPSGLGLAAMLFSLSAVESAAQDAAPAVLDAPAMLGARTADANSGNATALAGDKTRTRFVIGLERAVEFQVFSLANPNRVIVELPDIKLQLPSISGDTPVGLVQSFRGGLSAPGKMRVVIDVTNAVVVEKAVIDKGKDPNQAATRLVLEIVPAEAANKAGSAKKPVINAAVSGLGASGLQPPLPRPARRPEQRAANIFKPIIVIDPGHGGHDSGASKYGTVEKDVVLAFSLKLREQLQASGRYKVVMTRETDTFIELDDRREMADRAKAALFIAVHADYAGSDARGATIYSLRDNVANELQRAAKGQVSSDVLSTKELDNVKKVDGDVGAVKGFLTDLALKELAVNKERSRMFAGTVVETMGATTSMMNNPDREAGFRVLKSAKMPSVLIELAYVTNRADAANLKSDTWREKVSGSIVTAVDNYFSYHASRLPM